LKVVVIGPAYPMRGGVSNFNELYSKILLDKGWNVKNISYLAAFPKFVFPAKIPLEAGLRPEKLEIHPLIHTVYPFTWLRAINRIREIQPDLVIVHYWSTWLAPALGTILYMTRRYLKKTKIIAVVHHYKRQTKPVKKLLEKFFFTSVHGCITMAKTLRDDLKRIYRKMKVEFIYHPVYVVFGNKVSKAEARSYLKLNVKEPVILFFGIIRPYKGLDLLLQALAHEEVRKLGLRLIVAGEFSNSKEKCLQMIADLKLENHVIIVDEFIPTPAVKYYFSAADLIIQPYKSASHSGITQIAYQFERPMLVTDVGDLADIVPHMKVGYVSPVDAGSIAGYIVDFYMNHRAEEFARHLKVEKQRFSWDNMVNGLETMMAGLDEKP